MEMKDTRSGFGAGLTQLGRENPNVVALCADLTGSLKMNDFKSENPERFFQIGVAEANMIGIAAGMTIGGKIPFTGTFANFSTSRVYDQIRQSIAYSDKNVKICASHAGVTLGEDGATHQVLEDIGMMKMLPNMVVINPCDYNQTKAATIAIANYDGPVYLRFGRPKVPNFTPDNQTFEIGKAINLQEGTDITIVATGHLVWEALEAARTLINEGISVEVINNGNSTLIIEDDYTTNNDFQLSNQLNNLEPNQSQIIEIIYNASELNSAGVYRIYTNDQDEPLVMCETNGNIDGANIGEPAIDFELDYVANGQGSFRLSDQLGKVVVIAFFAPN